MPNHWRRVWFFTKRDKKTADPWLKRIQRCALSVEIMIESNISKTIPEGQEN